jgi:hypothetical protein
MVPQLPVIGIVPICQSWVNHLHYPLLSGHETRPLGHFNTNSSTPPLYRIIAFTYYTFKSEMLALKFNSASRILSSKTMDKSCNFAEVSL